MQSSNNPQVVVLGVGNTLMQDDGVGVHVVHELAQAGSLPKNVRLVDAGVAGAGWLQLLEGVEHLLIVDAVRGTEPPGSLYRMTLGALKTRNGPTLSAHEVGVIEVLAMDRRF